MSSGFRSNRPSNHNLPRNEERLESDRPPKVSQDEEEEEEVEEDGDGDGENNDRENDDESGEGSVDSWEREVPPEVTNEGFKIFDNLNKKNVQGSESEISPEHSSLEPVEGSNDSDDDESENDQSTNDTEPSSPTSHNSASTSVLKSECDDRVLRMRLLQYLLDFLNRKLPKLSKEQSLLGTVFWNEPKQAESSVWHLTWDDSVKPRQIEFANILNVPPDEINRKFWTVRAELVYPVFRLLDETIWLPILE